MSKTLRVFKCEHCGDLVELLDGQVTPVCCGEKMKEIVPAAVEAATEKHIPVYQKDGDVIHVSVGEVEHPMTEAHSIEYIWAVFDNRVERVHVCPGEKPQADFLVGDHPFTLYAYCNLHGLWVNQ